MIFFSHTIFKWMELQSQYNPLSSMRKTSYCLENNCEKNVFLTVATVRKTFSSQLFSKQYTVREMATNPKKNAPTKSFDFLTQLSISGEKSQNRLSFRRHPAEISPNSSNLSIGAPKLLKKLVWGTKCTRVVINVT